MKIPVKTLDQKLYHYEVTETDTVIIQVGIRVLICSGVGVKAKD
jgi:hypothetical protein